ncbi:alpha/beta hydrolase [bacterium]|nr:alpha/beta hydrolase [bacterium]
MMHALPPRLQFQPGSRPPAPPPGDRDLCGKVVEKAKDVFQAVSLLGAGLVFKHSKEKALKAEGAALKDVPNVKMSRPLLLCPGWTTDLHRFDVLSNRLLASGQNGSSAVYLHQGKAYRDNECTLPLDQIPSNTKIFVNIWDDRRSAPEVTAPQIKQNLELIQTALGPTKVDLVGFSMGGLASRKYLDEGGRHVGKFATLGTPHQGTRFGQWSNRILQHQVGWAAKPLNLTEKDAPAMQWLAADTPNLQQLNQNWPRQRAQIEDSLFLVSHSQLTPSTSWRPLAAGDGLVELDRATLPGAPTRILKDSPFLNHETLPSDSKMYREMAAFFGWQSLDPNR